MRNYVVGKGEENGELRFVCPEWVCPSFLAVLESELWGFLWGDSGLTDVLSETESFQLFCWPLTASVVKTVPCCPLLQTLSPALWEYLKVHQSCVSLEAPAHLQKKDSSPSEERGKEAWGETQLSPIPFGRFVAPNIFTSSILFFPESLLSLPRWSPSTGDRWPGHQDLDERTFLTT